MKNIFLLAIAMMSFELLAEDNPADVEKFKKCQAIKEQAPAAKETANLKEGYDTYPGSPPFQSCDKLSRGHLKTLYGKNGSRKSFNWLNYVNYSCWAKEKCGKDDEFKKCVEEGTKEAQACESLAYVISYYDRDWNDPEQAKAVTATSKAQAAQAANGQMTATQAAASASSIKCTSAGIETLDYEGCKKFTDQLEVIEAVQTVSYGVQETVYKSKMADSALKYGSEENTATGALKATADSLKDQESMYQQRSAVDATKLAYLYSIYNEIPRQSEITDRCSGIAGRNIEGLGTIDLNACKIAVTNGRGGAALANNQQVLDAMRTKLIAIATSLGSNTLLANLMGKRADDANAAIAKIDAFKPTDPATVTEEEALTTICKQNPGLAQCLTSNLDQTLGSISDNVVTFGDGGTGTSYVSASAIKDGTTSASGETSTDRTTVDSMGNPIVAAAQDNSIEASKGATVSSGGGGSTAPGGGGGGASASSGSGANPTPNQQAGGPVAAAVGKPPAYSGGDGISVSGGFGINKAKGEGKTEDNPFGKLFGKDNPNGNGVLNFRDIASQKVGDKKDNLFEMISKRYTNVAADKRLLEYELAK